MRFIIRLFSYLLIVSTFLFHVQLSSRPLNVLFYMRRFPNNTAWFVLNQMVEFLKRGHKVTIYTRLLDESSININHPDIVANRLLERTHTKVPSNGNFDIILCQSAYLAPEVIKHKEEGRLKGKLIVFVREAFKGDMLLNSAKKIFNSVDYMMPVSEHFKKVLINLGCDQKKIIVLHSTIDCKKFRYKKRIKRIGEPPIVVTTSRLTEKKGIDVAIGAINRLVRKYPNIQYRVLGDGILKPQLQRLIHKFHLERNIKLLGWKKPEEVVKILDDSHIFIHPSFQSSKGHQEGIPNAIMEAQAMGLPVVATWHGGIPEIVKNNVSGFLVPTKNSRALADKIDYLIQHPNLWPTMGYAGRLIVEKNFNREVENKKLMNICEKLGEAS